MSEQQQSIPPILVGLDAQPVENFAKAAEVGNALHRYDNGPSKNVTLKDWLKAADAKGLRAIVQGSAADYQAVDLSAFPAVAAIAHDDEPDLTRRDGSIYTSANAPHPSMVGWTLPTVLEERYKRWRKMYPQFPVTVNFNGKSLLNNYYKADLVYHAAYIKASDEQGLDLHVRNNWGDGGHLYWPAFCFDKLKQTGNPVDMYVECSDQGLDGNEGGGANRGPTPNEQATLFWSALGHGAKRVWYFPQRIGKDNKPSFLYLNVKPENWARMREDWATVQKYMTIIGTGKLTVEQSPPVKWDPNKGTLIPPNVETFTWTLGEERFEVFVDYRGASAVVMKYTGPKPPDPNPIPTPDPRDAQIDTLTKQLAAEKAARDAAERVASTAMATADKASASLAESKAVISESATAAVALVEALTGAPAIPAPSLPRPVIFTGRPYPDDNTGLPSCNFANFGWIVPNGNIYAATKEQVQAFARAVAEGKPHLEAHGNKLRPTAKGGPIIFEFEGCWDPRKADNPMRDKEDFPAHWTHADVSAHFANLIRWAKEAAPGVLIGCYGYPYGVEYQILSEFPINNAPDLFRPVNDLTDFTQGQFYVPSNDPKAYEDCRVLVMGLSDTIKRRYPTKPHFVWVNPQTVGNPLEDLTPATVAKFVLHTDEMCRGIEPGQPMGAKVIFTDDFAKWRRVMGPT